MNRATVLVVDDESQIVKAIRKQLEIEGYRIVEALDGEQALTVFNAEHPDLVILDIMLPRMDGFEVCGHLRKVSDAPIIILSAKGETVDKIVGFRMGVDDYMVKPFSLQELSLRVDAVLRRSGREKTGRDPDLGRYRRIQFDGFVIDRDTRTVIVDNREVELTPKEFDFLWLLASHPGYVFTKERLLAEIWGDDRSGDFNNVTVLVSRVRDKIEKDPSAPVFVKTVWGVGYKFDGRAA